MDWPLITQHDGHIISLHPYKNIKLHIEENEKFNLFFYPYDNPVKRGVVIMSIHTSKSILFMSVMMITFKFYTKKYFQISKFVYL